MDAIKPIETYYDGYKFRSRLEAKWAVFFNALGIEYEYEVEGMKLGDTCYLPDFYLPYFHVYVEIKRKSIEGEEREEAIRKISYGSSTDTFAGLICFGDPQDNDMILYCQDMDDNGGGSSQWKVEFAEDILTGELVFNRVGDPTHYDRTLFPTWESKYMIPSRTEVECTVTSRIADAKLTARRSRFEHGESPEV